MTQSRTPLQSDNKSSLHETKLSEEAVALLKNLIAKVREAQVPLPKSETQRNPNHSESTEGGLIEQLSDGEIFAVLHHPRRISPQELSPLLQTKLQTNRAYYVAEFFERWARELPRGSRILEIGGRKGLHRELLSPSRFPFEVKVTNVDPQANPDFLCEPTAIPLPPQSYDVIILQDIVTHSPTPDKILKEASRIVRLGGKLLATTPLLGAPRGREGEIARYLPQWWVDRLAGVGFDQIFIEPHGSLLSSAADMLASILPGMQSRTDLPKFLMEATPAALNDLQQFALMVERDIEGKASSALSTTTTGFGIAATKHQGSE